MRRNEQTGPGRRRRWWVWILVGALLLAAALGAGYERVLRVVAHGWLVDEPVERAAAIVVLGGGEDYRPFAAARLWREGWAPVVLVPDVEVRRTEAMGLRPPVTEVILGVLKAEGVPERAIVRIGREVTSTRDEAVAVRQWAEGGAGPQAGGSRRLLIPTDPFATRRTDWIFRRVLPEWDVRVVRTDPATLDFDRWWMREDGVLSFQSEWVKMAYYLVRY